MLSLDDPITEISGCGDVLAKRFKRLGVEKVKDLLYLLPRRLEDFSKPIPIAQVLPGRRSAVWGELSQISLTYTKKRGLPLVSAKISDKASSLKVVWFNQPYLKRILKEGKSYILSGEVQKNLLTGETELLNPIIEKKPGIFAIYPETKGLTSKVIRNLVGKILSLKANLTEFLPDWIQTKAKVVSEKDAIWLIHRPKSFEDYQNGKRRLAFNELFLLILSQLELKRRLKKLRGLAIPIDEELLKKFVKSLPFKLTDDQRKAAWRILQDMEKPVPMNRLLEGEVGSGKTVVVLLASLNAMKQGWRAVWMAPTEILAHQHYGTAQKLLSPFKIKVGLLTAGKKTFDTQSLVPELIIGTHALIQKGIRFKDLGLIVVDEQHRFGVQQRAELVARGQTQTDSRTDAYLPHFLSMTATPIPRTLTMTLYGSLDLLIIRELPKGRQKVSTQIVAPEKRSQIYEFLKSQIKKGLQAYVVAPLIEEVGGRLIGLFEERRSAEGEFQKLQNIFPDLKIGLLHGRLKSKEKTQTIDKFRKKQLDILVTTSVVEVGMDIPNANLILIEGAEWFGLAQLYQLRGRVGRSTTQAYCFLFTEKELTPQDKGYRRLKAIVSAKDGFELSEYDLALRGPGELTGLEQSGFLDLKIASLSDKLLIEEAQKLAKETIERGLEKWSSLEEKIREYLLEKSPASSKESNSKPV